MAKQKKAVVKSKKINGPLLPRAYLSWSQLDLWERDPDEYKRRYFYGKPSIENDAMRFGKHIAAVLEGKEKPANHTEQSVKLLCQQYDKPEHHIRVKMKTVYGEVMLEGYIDSFNSTTCSFIENKTGTTKWTSKKAGNHGQMHFYYILILLSTGTRIPSAILQHLDTVADPRAKFGRKLSGYIYPYEVELSVGHELEMRRRIENAVREISQAYQAALQIKA